MMLEIPIAPDNDAIFSLSVNLDDVSVAMRFSWNSRSSAWFLDVESVNGKNNGIRLAENRLLLGSKNKTLPLGSDFILLKRGVSAESGLDFFNLGSDYIVYYADKESVEALKKAIKEGV